MIFLKENKYCKISREGSHFQQLVTFLATCQCCDSYIMGIQWSLYFQYQIWMEMNQYQIWMEMNQYQICIFCIRHWLGVFLFVVACLFRSMAMLVGFSLWFF